MKVLAIDYAYFKYPENIGSVDEFAKYLNNNYNSFIKLTEYCDENCVEPYFIESETKEVYVNPSRIKAFSEHDITLLSKDEYGKRLEKTVKEKCANCQHYKEHLEDNLKGHWGKISLDGECVFYEPIEEE